MKKPFMSKSNDFQIVKAMLTLNLKIEAERQYKIA